MSPGQFDEARKKLIEMMAQNNIAYNEIWGKNKDTFIKDSKKNLDPKFLTSLVVPLEYPFNEEFNKWYIKMVIDHKIEN